MAADIYSVEPHTGRGGWTWYTGSASWTYRVALESLQGLRLQPEGISFSPRVPQDWDLFEVNVRVGSATWQFTIIPHQRPDDGEDTTKYEAIYPTGSVCPVVDDGGTHRVLIQSPKTTAISCRTVPAKGLAAR